MASSPVGSNFTSDPSQFDQEGGSQFQGVQGESTAQANQGADQSAQTSQAGFDQLGQNAAAEQQQLALQTANTDETNAINQESGLESAYAETSKSIIQTFSQP